MFSLGQDSFELRVIEHAVDREALQKAEGKRGKQDRSLTLMSGKKRESEKEEKGEAAPWIKESHTCGRGALLAGSQP